VKSDKSIDELLASIAEGKDVKPDIFEDIKNISRNDESIGEEGAVREGQAEPTEFECPVCGARVEASATQCPGCGAQFAEEEPQPEKFECPLCGASVDASATKCPSCGVEFEEEVKAAGETQSEAGDELISPQMPTAGRKEAEEEVESALGTAPARYAPRPAETVTAARPAINLRERIDAIRTMEIAVESIEGMDKKTLYRELPRIVNEVKPLLLSAKKVGVSIEDSRQLINDAIAFGKKKEMERAVMLVIEAKASLQKAFIVELTSQLESILIEVEKARATGSPVSSIERAIDEAVILLEAGRYGDVGVKVAQAREEFSARAGGYYKAKESIQVARALVDESAALGVDTLEAKRAITRASEALEKRKWEQSELEAGRARDIVMKQLPKQLDKEMKHARNVLLDLKVKGGDLTKPIGILKQASIHLKREEYADAVHYVMLFRQEIGSA